MVRPASHLWNSSPYVTYFHIQHSLYLIKPRMSMRLTKKGTPPFSTKIDTVYEIFPE